MNEVNMFKIKEKFKGTDDLYRYLLKNIDFIGKSVGIQIQKPIKLKPFCIVGKEIITERNILFFASKSEFPENLGELIALAGTFDVDIIVYFVSKLNPSQIDSLNWLKKICNDDIQFIFSETDF